jgi:hypothetical protein
MPGRAGAGAQRGDICHRYRPCDPSCLRRANWFCSNVISAPLRLHAIRRCPAAA